jgi:PAS domain S-box-containing protein
LSFAELSAGSGTMGARIQAYDWPTSPLGPPEQWPQDLRAALRIMLRSKFPTLVAWGPELICFYNDAYLALRGTRPEALGRSLPQAWMEIWETTSLMVAQALRGEATYVQDVPVDIVQRKGHPEQTWWTASFSPVMDEAGAVGGVLIILQETTERILTEQRLRFLVDLSTRLRGIAEARNVMATAAEMLGRHLRASRVGYAEISECGVAFAVECDWTDAAMPSFAGEYRIGDFGALIESELRAGRTVRIDDVLADPLTTEETIAAEFLRTRKRATVIAPLIRDDRLIASLYVHQAQPRHWREDEVALVREVAERTWTSVLRARAETALRNSEQLFRQFAEHAIDVLWVVDADTRGFAYVSPAYERVWGRPMETIKDRTQWEESIHPDDRDRTAQAFQGVLRGETVTHEYRIVRPDGSMRYIHATVFPILDERGAIQRIGGVARDVTQHDGSMVYIVDGNEASRRNLSLTLQEAGYQVKPFASAQAFLEVAPVLVPGCVVLDTRAPEADGLAIPKELKARRAGLPIVVLGESRGLVAVGVEAMKAGAVDFLEASCRPEQLLEAVASAMASIRDVAERDQTAELARDRIAALAPREREVLDGLLAGGTNKTIARDLGISPRTVEAHRARIMERLGAQSLPELVQVAMAAGLRARHKAENPDHG